MTKTRLGLSHEQAEAAARVREFLWSGASPFFTIHGYAGTGKTTLLAALAAGYPDAWICAPTGRAAANLAAKVQSRKICTIHQLIYHFEGKDDEGELKWKDKRFFGRLVFLDECSMVNENLARDLLQKCGKLIAFGDPGQLPPVNGKQFFMTADVTLREIHRQALDSPIIREAWLAREGLPYAADGELFRVLPLDLNNHGVLDAIRQANMILTYRNDTRRQAIQVKRGMLGLMDSPRPGEPVMALKNDHKRGLLNGEIYPLVRYGQGRIIVAGADAPLDISNAAFEGEPDFAGDDKKPFAFGYAATVHKAQGSEWPHVVIVDENYGPDRITWLYTAITRAGASLTILKP